MRVLLSFKSSIYKFQCIAFFNSHSHCLALYYFSADSQLLTHTHTHTGSGVSYRAQAQRRTAAAFNLVIPQRSKLRDTVNIYQTLMVPFYSSLQVEQQQGAKSRPGLQEISGLTALSHKRTKCKRKYYLRQQHSEIPLPSSHHLLE